MHALGDSRDEARTGWAGLELFGNVGLEPKTKGQNTAFKEEE